MPLTTRASDNEGLAAALAKLGGSLTVTDEMLHRNRGMFILEQRDESRQLTTWTLITAAKLREMVTNQVRPENPKMKSVGKGVSENIERNKREGLLCACNKVRVPYGPPPGTVQTTDGVVHGYEDCGKP